MGFDIDGIRYETQGETAYVTIDKPETHNALTREMIEGIPQVITDADEDESIRAIIVTGAGDEAFCSGGDLGEMIPQVTAGEFNVGRDISHREPKKDFQLKHNLVKTPIIAAVNGYCIAGGTEFLLATDIRVAEEHAEFALQEVRWGLAPSGGSHTRLPRQIPYAKAMEILLTGDRINAEEAREFGLVNKVVEKGTSMEVAEEYAKTVAKNGPLAVKKAKEAAVRCLSLPMEQAFYTEEAIIREVLDSDDAVEGPKAFMENREPNFTGE